MSVISTKGLDKAQVLAALYNGARPQGFGFLHYDPTPMTAEEAQKILDKGSADFDYLNGRVMKVDLSGDEFDPWLYDRDNGQDTAARIIESLRSTSKVDTEETEMRHLEGTRRAAQDVKDHLNEKSRFVAKEGEIPTVELGLGEFADKLGPKIDKILDDES